MRQYMVFGSDDGIHWTNLGLREASTHNQAMAWFLESTAFSQYAACPLRNWSSAAPQIKQRAPVVTWEKIGVVPEEVDPNQLAWEEAQKPVKESPAQAAKRLREDLAEDGTP